MDIRKYAERLYGRSEKPVFITRGSKGIAVCDGKGFFQIPGVSISKEIDSVGAGDTVVSSLALCMAAGVEPREAAEFANLAATATVQKLFRTGTASIEDILNVNKQINKETK